MRVLESQNNITNDSNKKIQKNILNDCLATKSQLKIKKNCNKLKQNKKTNNIENDYINEFILDNFKNFRIVF